MPNPIKYLEPHNSLIQFNHYMWFFYDAWYSAMPAQADVSEFV